MPAGNNSGIVTIRDVTHTAVAMEQLNKYISAETISRNIRRALFSVGPPRRYITRELRESLESAFEDDREMARKELGFEN
jgi:hypothetical protein